MRNFAIIFAALVSLFAVSMSAHAVNPDEVLDDPVLEERARTLSVQIRCLVCQNQSIDDSDAELARDLRILVREKLVEGLDDRQVMDYLVERYGEFVLLKPPVNSRTFFLWGFPFALLLFGGLFVGVYIKRRRVQPVESKLSDEERKALSRILEEK